MPTVEAFALRPETAASLVNLAVAASLICGLALVLVWLGRSRPAPLRHGILMAAVGLLLSCPLLLWIGQPRGLVQFSVSVGQPIAAPSTTERAPVTQSPSLVEEPPSPGLPEAVADPSPTTDRPVEQAIEHSLVQTSPRAPARPLAWWQLLGSLGAGLWLTGILAGALRLAWGYWILLRLRRSLQLLDNEQSTKQAEQAACSLGLRRSPPVFASPLVPVPLSLGLFRPAVVLPEDLAQTGGEEELEAVLIHELAHIRRHDHWIGLAQRAATILFWWNPLVWKLCDQISELREEICDNYVLQRRGEGHRLARVLLDLVARVSDHGPLPATVGVLEPRLTGFAGRIKRLVNKEHDMSTRMSRVSMLLVLLGSLTLFSAMVVWGGIQVVCAQEKAATPAPAQQPPTKPAAESFTFRGRVVAPNDRPVQGAKIYLVQLRPDEPVPVQVRATTGPDGAFQFTMAKAELINVDVRAPGISASVVAVAEGFGPALDFADVFDSSGEIRRGIGRVYPWVSKAALETREPVLKLVEDDVPLVGRILDLQGHPVAGVAVRVQELYGSRSGDLGAWLTEAQLPKGDFYKARSRLDNSLSGAYVCQQLQQILPGATTDADGRFTLHGLGRERVVTLGLKGPGIATQEIGARTRRGPTLQVASGPQTWTYYGAAFEHVVQPSGAVIGTVRDHKTGQPLAGVAVELHRHADHPISPLRSPIRTLTDPQGRYQLTGMPPGEDNEIRAVPPLDQPYLIAKKKVPPQAGQGPATVDFDLERGIWLRGRVTDARTGDPVRGYVKYFVVLDNPHDKSAPRFEMLDHHYFIDVEGRYAIPGLPRRGIVTVSANNHESYPRGAGTEKIDAPKLKAGADMFVTAPNYCIPMSFHALAAVNPPKGAQSVQQDFALNPHQTLHGTVLDPVGQPLPGTSYIGMGDLTGWRPLDSARFVILSYQPDKPRTLLFVQRELKLAGGRVLQGDVQEPLTVKLEPWGVLTGRVVDDQGKPRGGITVRSGNFENDDLSQGRLPEPGFVTTDAEGHFRAEGLVPRMKYSLMALQQRTMPMLLGQLVTDISVNSGETKDLGDLKITLSVPSKR